MPSLAQHFAPGTIVGGRYRIEAIIGQGGFGAVFRATQLNLDRPVALKALLPEAIGDEGLARFQREAEIVQQLDHPNVVRLLDFGVEAGADPYLVFELLQGQTLEEAIRAGGPMPPARAARITAQILKALMEAHARGIVHRDVKPANVFLSSFQGEPDFVKVLDFGIAKGAGSRTLTQRGGVLGTPAYMAPEQVTGGEATFATDLYALALTVEEAITGRQVYAGVSLVDIVREHVSPNPVPHDAGALASPLGPVIERASRKVPGQRYASTAEMLAHVEAVMGSGPASAHVPVPSLGAVAMHTERGGGYVSGAFEQASMQGGPLVPPAPSRAPRKKKGGGTPWAVFAAIGGGVVLLGGALVAVVSMGGGGRTKGSAAQPSASGFGSDVAGATGTHWADAGDELDLVEANVNGDAVPDFVGYCTKTDTEVVPYELCAVDGATFRTLWRKPLGFDAFTASSHLLGAAGRAIAIVDGGGVVRLLDAATGSERGAVRLGGHADRLCAPPDAPGKLWIKMKEARGVMVDTAARTAVDAPRPASCRLSVHEPGCGFVKDVRCPPALPEIQPPSGLSYVYGSVDGEHGVAVADKMRDSNFRVMFGFDPRAREAKALWQRPIAPGDGLGAVMGSHHGHFDVFGGRALAAYDDPQGATHLVMVDAATGRTLWDATTPRFRGFMLTLSRLYANVSRRIEVRDAATGRLLGGSGGDGPGP